jgi:hypothetical protein
MTNAITALADVLLPRRYGQYFAALVARTLLLLLLLLLGACPALAVEVAQLLHRDTLPGSYALRPAQDPWRMEWVVESDGREQTHTRELHATFGRSLCQSPASQFIAEELL